MWKRGEIAPKEQFLLFSTLFYIYIFLTSGVKLHIHLLNMVVQFIAFLTLSTLICQGTDISKNFSESLGIQDNESRLYLVIILEYFFLFLYKNIFCGSSVEVLQWVPKSMFKEKWENYHKCKWASRNLIHPCPSKWFWIIIHKKGIQIKLIRASH